MLGVDANALGDDDDCCCSEGGTEVGCDCAELGCDDGPALPGDSTDGGSAVRDSLVE